MFEIDNRNGIEPIYFIIDVAPFYGAVEIGQVSNSIFEFVEYADKSLWIADMDDLGIEHEEHPTMKPEQ